MTIPVPTLTDWSRPSTSVKGLLTWLPRHSTGTKKFGNWSVAVLEDGTRNIYHYTTLMLVVTGHGDVLDCSLGWGSVTDQQKMNQLFNALGSDHHFVRAGGAHIIGPYGVSPEASAQQIAEAKRQRQIETAEKARKRRHETKVRRDEIAVLYANDFHPTNPVTTVGEPPPPVALDLVGLLAELNPTG